MESCLLHDGTYVETACPTRDLISPILVERTSPVKRAPTHSSESRPKRASDSRVPSTVTNASRTSDDQTQRVTAQLTEITDALTRQFEARLQQERLDFQTQLTHNTTQQQLQHQ